MVDEDMRKIDRWTGRYSIVSVVFEDEEGVDPFFNINRAEDLAAAEQLISNRP